MPASRREAADLTAIEQKLGGTHEFVGSNW